MGLLSGLLGGSSNKADNSTSATDNSLTQATGSTGVSSGGKGASGSSAQDQAVSVSGSRNTVDQSVNLDIADNTGSFNAQKIGNNNQIAVTNTVTDHGAVESAFDFGGDVIASSERTTNNALVSNTLISAGGLELADRVAQTALANQRASEAASAATAGRALEANERVSSDAISGMVNFGESALSTVVDVAQSALDANESTNARAFSFAENISETALGAVKDTSETAMDFMSDALANYHVATLQSVNNANAQNESANALIDSTLAKFAENKTPALAENKTLLIGGLSLLGAVIVGSLASVAMAHRPASRPEPRKVTPHAAKHKKGQK
ncbi:hypothetical protein OpiT1DRAFT_01234 [Opitutaceae bacterium TAV1]|nr:hypothetical protein OpiT1DRAFT_01234 [Opitutaceae bacterium TAV1]